MVVTHGWAPGLRPAYERLQSATPDLVTIWNPALVTADGTPALGNFGPLLGALQTADPGATVLMFSWVDQSATTSDPLSARDAENATEINGHRLAVAVDQVLAPGWSGQLHLMGHSFGANVATTAALAVAAPPRQLTLMDSPEVALARLGGAMNDLRYKLPRLEVGRLAAQTFVDSYISLVGAPYSGLPGLAQVVDVRLAPPSGDTSAEEHEYPTVWYRQALETKGDPATGPVVVAPAGRRPGDGRSLLPGAGPGHADRADPGGAGAAGHDDGRHGRHHDAARAVGRRGFEPVDGRQRRHDGDRVVPHRRHVAHAGVRPRLRRFARHRSPWPSTGASATRPPLPRSGPAAPARSSSCGTSTPGCTPSPPR